MTEWHARYGGPIVGIYWHVERNAACIYSQLKTCSSSEVAAMIQGVLRHCTEMEIDRHYVDSHGQSTLGFAFCRLLGFDTKLQFMKYQFAYRESRSWSAPATHRRPTPGGPRTASRSGGPGREKTYWEASFRAVLPRDAPRD